MRKLFHLNDNIKIYVVMKKCNFKNWEKILFLLLSLSAGIVLAYFPIILAFVIAYFFYNTIVSEFDNGEYPNKKK